MTKYTVIGLNVAAFMICPARVNSMKPMIEASEVFFTKCTQKPMVGGMLNLTAWGMTT